MEIETESNPQSHIDNVQTKTLRQKIITALAITLSCVFLYFNISVSIPDNYISAIHFAGYGILCLLMHPLFSAKNSLARGIGFTTDVAMCIALVFVVGYLMLFEDTIANRNYDLFLTDYIVGSIAMLLGLEIVRRTMGWVIPLIIVIGISYVLFWGQYISGIFHFPGISLEYFINNNFFGDNEDGLFGTLAGISWSMVFIFILFGAFLVQHGTGDFIIRLSHAAVGRLTGGPGLVAVLGSGLMGSVSGSAIANTTATGVITIPLMKKAGFPAKFAAAVEAGASTGGQLIPPIMGAGVFIMISYTSIDFFSIIKAAFLPGVLYFITIGIYVRIQAIKCGLKPSTEQTESVLSVLKEGWHYLLPLVLLVILMVQGFTPTYAGGYATLSIIVFSWFSKHKMTFNDIKAALDTGSKNCAMIAVLLVTISLFVNSINISGLSVTFSHMITEWAGSNLLLMLTLVALASLVVGMGLPVTASYIVLATLCAPALYALIAQHGLVDMVMAGSVPEATQQIIHVLAPDLGALLTSPTSELSLVAVTEVVQALPLELRNQLLDLSFDPYSLSMMMLSAHMIIFWLSQDSNVTPPVCLVAFAAASIAKTPPMATGVEAWKTAKGLYIIPIMFAYTSFIGGTLAEQLHVFFAVAIGMYAFVASLYGYLETQQSPLNRLILATAGILLIWPNMPYYIDLAAVVVIVALLLMDIKKNRTEGQPVEA